MVMACAFPGVVGKTICRHVGYTIRTAMQSTYDQYHATTHRAPRSTRAPLRVAAAAAVETVRVTSAPRTLSTHPPQTAADAKYANYTAKKAFLFPGQGAQSVGMAKVPTCT